mmetsp:Transcript_7568/g.22967  ORF Transcript_7568/g.22967 Transcript_7568/m.22967 type:complete len:85 (-) Transcript_7568:152-406(-)|eukprot:CAMPEP_0198724128 /NCGR_PEP_ID=MMETSP1475-20131203/1631_1 /TAXON_ID= ORGANISM="Unidentified sp., Strain CCMP1999" /NCGR_SAMPLE_ID=MMETSP1475 /ASSEMBLY_ACC=CAM_ASM_001111 /LENGTH=84 /DNA_ID=CAMNT_0044485553 /DNA_START=143 /DNA_END=397 /DNA_ORIENTATION=-
MTEKLDEEEKSQLRDVLRVGIIVVAVAGVAWGALQEIRRRQSGEEGQSSAGAEPTASADAPSAPSSTKEEPKLSSAATPEPGAA